MVPEIPPAGNNLLIPFHPIFLWIWFKIEIRFLEVIRLYLETPDPSDHIKESDKKLSH